MVTGYQHEGSWLKKPPGATNVYSVNAPMTCHQPHKVGHCHDRHGGMPGAPQRLSAEVRKLDSNADGSVGDQGESAAVDQPANPAGRSGHGGYGVSSG